MREFMRSAWLIAAAVLIPILMFVVVQTGFSAREERRAVEARAMAKSETVIASSDATLARSIGAIEVLATIQALPRGDIAGFYQRAMQIRALNPDWVTVKLTQVSDGTEWFDLRRPLGAGVLAARPPHVPERTEAGRIERAGSGCPCVVIERKTPGPDGGYVLSVLMSTKAFERLLPPPGSEYPVSAIVTGKGRFIARSLAQDERAGTFGSKYLQAAALSGEPMGQYRGFTLEGLENYTAFTRSRLTGWSAHIALDSHYVDRPAQVAIRSFGVGALLSLLLAGVLVWFALRSIAASRRAAERGQQAQKIEALGQLTGGIAHDFNNLLTPIVGALDFIMKGNLDERARRIAGGALASAQRAGKLTAQLLAFSRRQKLEIVPVDVPMLFDEIRPLLDQSVGSGHHVEIRAAADATCVKSDVNQLELALLNLVINARDATPEGGTIRVTSELARDGDQDMVLIRVIDQGEGMSGDVLQRAAEPFFTTKQLGRGSGLGLAQVFAVMQQSSGSVDIDSEVGRGTTVTLRMPKCEEPAAPRQRARPAGDAAEASRPLRLLLVDDDAAVRASIARSFEDDGHTVDSVGDGRIALTAIEHCDYDLVIVDFAMPAMDGAAVIREARKLKPDQKFLMVTGYADSDAVAAACPDTPVLRKPFDGDALRRLVADITA